MRLRRREFLGAGIAASAGLSAGGLFAARVAFAATPSAGEARLVFVLLRGALDGLSAVPPYGDPAYAGLRRELAIAAPGSTGGAYRLDGTFALHPALKFMSESYSAKQLLVAHAVASPYRDRSHFDGQDVLEGGGLRPHAFATGWLNRALAARPGNMRNPGASGETGVALGQNVPLAMRGPAPVASWSPSKLGALDDDTLERLADLYASDPVLSRRLADALSTDAIARGAQAMDAPGAADVPRASGRRGGANLGETVKAAAAFLARANGPQVAMFDTGGWDTHANEGNATGQLAARLGALDAGMRTLKESLGGSWHHTVELIATEFGRTAAANGTRGTDHGTGAAAFLLGGAVQGGRVLADWPGLAAAQLYQGRDLAPTTDLRAILKGVLRDHLAVSEEALQRDVFPDSAAVRPLRELVRG